MFHAAAEPRTGLGVVICPPFGWEDMASYRPRRELAQALAERGIATLRFDLPGTGDSGGYPTDDRRLDAWTGAIVEATAWLRNETGCRRVVAIGIGVGGLLAYCATAGGALIDDLVLWGAPARGRTFIRETSAFARMEAALRAKGDEDVNDELPLDWLAAGGYVITAETRAALETLDVGELTLPSRAGRRALLLERDGLSVDSRLIEAVARQQISVDTAPGSGWGKMMVEPQFARPPAAVVQQITDWISALDTTGTPLPATQEIPRATNDVHVRAPDGTLVRESFLSIPHSLGTMFAVLTEPLEGARKVTCLLLGGTGHRIGPNRMWVEAARRWAACGVTTVRLDLAGAGDAGGITAPDVPALYAPELTEQLSTVFQELERRGLPSRTLAVGLCAGAYWALHASLHVEQEVIPIMINPRVLIWDDRGHVNRMSRHYLEQVRHASSWRRLARGEISLVGARKLLLQRLGMIASLRRKREPALQFSENIDRLFDELRDRDLRPFIMFTGRESLFEEFRREGRLERLERWPNLTLEVVPGRSDLHTLRQIWLQRKVHMLLDDALRRELHFSEPKARPQTSMN
jgi:pimeloyl-ACP methyl ester carboxylesterase